MKYNPEIHHRRSIRLKGYDYSSEGIYFITICAQNREYLFGEIVDGEMVLNDAGQMIENIWSEMPNYYAGVEIDAYQIMPNHFHGIILLVGAGPCACPSFNIAQPRINARQPQGVAPTAKRLSLLDAVHRFKTMTTKRYTDGVKHNNWPPFNKKLWQRNYYEHIIRDDESLYRIREYIINNPLQWNIDDNNPASGQAR